MVFIENFRTIALEDCVRCDGKEGTPSAMLKFDSPCSNLFFFEFSSCFISKVYFFHIDLTFKTLTKHPLEGLQTLTNNQITVHTAANHNFVHSATLFRYCPKFCKNIPVLLSTLDLVSKLSSCIRHILRNLLSENVTTLI
jgi:hypothetical protein